MLPLMHHACAETTGALWSSRTMTVRPFSKVMRRVPGGQAGMPAAGFLKATRLRETTDARIRNRAPRVRLQMNFGGDQLNSASIPRSALRQCAEAKTVCERHRENRSLF